MWGGRLYAYIDIIAVLAARLWHPQLFVVSQEDATLLTWQAPDMYGPKRGGKFVGGNGNFCVQAPIYCKIHILGLT